MQPPPPRDKGKWQAVPLSCNFNMALRRCVGGGTAALGLERTAWPILLSSVSNDGFSAFNMEGKHSSETGTFVRKITSLWTTDWAEKKENWKWPHAQCKCTLRLIVDMNILALILKRVMYSNTKEEEPWRKSKQQGSDGMEENNVMIEWAAKAEAVASPTSSTKSGMRGMKW